jgi:hypothetical protein
MCHYLITIKFLMNLHITQVQSTTRRLARSCRNFPIDFELFGTKHKDQDLKLTDYEQYVCTKFNANESDSISERATL